jgi:hypothetical protein
MGEFAMMFPRVERHVTWAIESFTCATRWDGNELEGMIQNFTSRIKVLDIVARPRCKTAEDNGARVDVVNRLRALNSLRNKLFHLEAVGTKHEINLQDLSPSKGTLAMMLKQLDGNTGRERNIDIPLTELQQKPHEMAALIMDIRRWVHNVCPDAAKHVP